MKKMKALWLAALLGTTIGMSQLPAHAQAPSAAKPAYYVAEFQATDPEGSYPANSSVSEKHRWALVSQSER